MNVKLSYTDKKEIVAAIQTKNVSMTELAVRYGVTQPTISRTFKKMTGKSLRPYKISGTDTQVVQDQINMLKLESALNEFKFRAWHKKEKRMYQWNELVGGRIKWLFDNDDLEPMLYSGLPDTNGQDICSGDIIQFPLNLDGKETIVKDVVAYDREKGMFTVVGVGPADPLALYNYECQVIGNVHENPEMVNEVASKSVPAFP